MVTRAGPVTWEGRSSPVRARDVRPRNDWSHVDLSRINRSCTDYSYLLHDWDDSWFESNHSYLLPSWVHSWFEADRSAQESELRAYSRTSFGWWLTDLGRNDSKYSGVDWPRQL